LLGPDGISLKVGSQNHNQIITDIREVTDGLLELLTQNPHYFYQLPSGKFEEVVAEIMYRMGYTIELTSKTRDGGKDIYAAKKDSLGAFLYIVECKKYAPDNNVSVGVIRQLYGVVQAEKATAGILATTSFFSKDSKQFQETVPYQISLQDYFGLQQWLKEIKNVKK
jgi:restriction system protein